MLVAGIGAYIPVTLLAEPPEATASMTELEVMQPTAFAPVLPDVGASAISVMGAEDFEGTVGVNGILAASGDAGPRPIASISKVITALLILEARPLAPGESGPTLTFGKAEADLYDKYYVMGATVESMRRGSAVTQRDALELILAASASNYAEAVSTWAFGSPAKFRAAVTAWLGERGLAGTSIVEPTGIDPRNVSTPADLIAIGKLAMANPVVAEIVQSPSVEVPGLGVFGNRNDLLGVSGVNGIKTGTLEEHGTNLLFSAVMDVGAVTNVSNVSASAPITVVGVVLGGYNHVSVNNAVRELLDSVAAGFTEVPLVAEGQQLGSYTTAWGDAAAIVTGNGASVFTWSDTPITSTVTTRSIAMARSGTEVGSVTFVADGSTVTVPLVLKGAIEGPDEWWRLTHPGEMLGLP